MDGCIQLPPFVAMRGVAEEPRGAGAETQEKLVELSQRAMRSLIYVKDVGMKLSFPSICLVMHPIIHPSKFLIAEEEDDGRGGGGMAAAAVYPNVYVIQSYNL
jgi:hypothetical protein